jgi:hypothetical protein
MHVSYAAGHTSCGRKTPPNPDFRASPGSRTANLYSNPAPLLRINAATRS